MIKKTFVKSKSTYKVTFSLPKTVAANANEVKVLGEFNNWQWENGLKMKATKTAYTAVLELESGRDYQFRYLIDNNNWENDWEADAYTPNPYGVENSIVLCPSVAGVPVTNTPKAKITIRKTVKKASPAKKTATAKKATAKKVATKKTTAKKTVATKKAAPAKKKATKKQQSLQVIEGVGPKIEQLMNQAGLVTFADVAKASVPSLKKILTDAGSRYTMHNPTTWPKQAKLAKAGKWDALKELQDSLKGGRA